MNTKKEIVKFLEELAVGVQDKADNLEQTVRLYKNKCLDGGITPTESQKNIDLLRSFELSLEHCEGQLYEINYILSTITRDNRKKDI